MIIQRLELCSDEFMQALSNLMPQLTSNAVLPSKTDIESIIHSSTTSIWVAREENDNIVGMLALAIYKTPTGIHGWIEDVVVDEHHRKKGIGKALTLSALAFAELKDAKAVSLTSRPFRKAANRLYQNIGFKVVETNLYRYYFEKLSPK
jgi:ribosomal protein S18 acetylase RimI-like enzyme